MVYYCYFDGATDRTNPSDLLGIGGYIENQYEDLVYEFWGPVNKYGTNNSAEYLALLQLTKFFEDRITGRDYIIFHGDSNLVCKQMEGKWRIKDGIYKKDALKTRAALDVLHEKTKYEIFWIPREENKRADELSKMGLLEKELMEVYYDKS